MAYASKKRLADNSIVPLGSNLFGTCSTASSTGVKVVNMPDFNVLVEGVTIHVYFEHKNTNQGITALVVGSTLLAPVRYNGADGKGKWEDGSVISFTYYDGYWYQNDVDAVGASPLTDLFRPVGSYYETSDASFDPNTAWGGTWVLETEGQVHVSAGSDYVIDGALDNTSDGGEVTHKLSLAEMPSHNHNSKSISGTLNAYTWADGASSGIVSKKTEAKNQKATSGDQIGWVTYTINATHTHDTQGSGTAHNNMQPYIVVNRWHRIA